MEHLLDISLECNCCAILHVTSDCFMSVTFVVELDDDDDDEAWLCHIHMYLYVVMLYIGNFE
jgi:hypothetical protein